MSADRLVATGLERHDSLFVAPHGDDVALGCPARMQYETELGRRVLVLALFEPVGTDTPAARERRSQRAPATRLTQRGPEDEDVAFEAARLLAEIGPCTQAVHIYAPL